MTILQDLTKNRTSGTNQTVLQNLKTQKSSPTILDNLKNQSMGVQAKTPTLPSSGNMTLASSQVKYNPTESSEKKMTMANPTSTKTSTSSDVLSLQKQLNAKNAGKTGWVPLVEDGIMGPKTKAAQTWEPTVSQETPTYTAPTSSYTAPTGGYTPPNSTYTAPTSTTGTNVGYDTTNTGLLASLAKKGTTGAEYEAINKTLTQKQQELKDLRDTAAKEYANIMSTEGPAEFKTGKARAMQELYAQREANLTNEIAGLTNQLGAANTQQQLQTGALSSAVGYTQPVSQFGMLTSPQTGQIVGGSGATASNVMNNAVQQAYSMITSSKPTDYNTAIKASGLDTLGPIGIQALNNMLSGGGTTFSPTIQTAQSGAIAQSVGQMTGQEVDLSTNLLQVDRLAPIMQNFLLQSGVNPTDAAAYNGTISDYLRAIGNSGAISQWESMAGELKNYTSQILSSNYGGTPTGVEQATLNQDPTKLGYSQFVAYLNTLKQLGDNKLNTIQTRIGQLGGTQTGTTAPISTSTKVSPVGTSFGSGITSPAGQFAAGVGVNTLPNLAQTAGYGLMGGTGAKLTSKLLQWFGL